MTIDLRPLAATVEAEMVDACTIHRGRPGYEDAVLDPDTLDLDDPAAVLLYTGECLIAGGGSALEEVGGDQEQVSTWRLLLPWTTAADLQRGDLLTITASKWHPDRVGARYLLRDETTSTLSPVRRFQLEARR